MTYGSFEALSDTEVFVMGEDGKLWLEQGPFGQQVPPARQQIDASVQAFQALSGTEVLVLGNDGKLWLEHGPFGRQVPPVRQQVDGSVQAFQALSDTEVLVLGADGKLWLEHGPFGQQVPPAREAVDSGVRSFHALSDTELFVLGEDRRLWLEHGPFGQQVPPVRQQVDANVLAFQALSDAQVVVLGNDRTLWLEVAPFGSVVPPSRQLIDASVQSFQALSATEVLVLGGDAKLWLERAPFGQQLPPTRQQVDGDVLAFQALSDREIVVLGNDRKLWLEHGPFGQQVPPVRQQIDGTVGLTTVQPESVLLDGIAGLGAPHVFGPIWDNTTFSSVAMSDDGRVAYFGRTARYDPQMRNLAVALLDAGGNVQGIPKCYPTSTRLLAPIDNTSQPSPYNTTITALALNSAKGRLYMGETRSATTTPTAPGLNVYTLDSNGNPEGAVRTYANGNVAGNGSIECLLIHPALPVLYIAGWGMTGVAVQALDENGEPSGAPVVHNLGTAGKYALGISADTKFLYMGTYSDILEVVALDSNGSPTGTVSSHTVNNAQVGTINDYLRFAMGANAIYMVRPGPSGSGLPILALWPIDPSSGQPVGAAQARTDINPPLVGGGALTLAPDNVNGRLWLATLTSSKDAFTDAMIVSGLTESSYAINGDGTLGDGAPGLPRPLTANAAVLAFGSSRNSAVFFNASMTLTGNLVKGYQCRVTVTAQTGGSFPMTFSATGTVLLHGRASYPKLAFGSLRALNTPSAWVGLDTLLRDQTVQVLIQVEGPSQVTSMTVRFDLADATGTILKSVTETVQSYKAAFLAPGYAMSAAALTGNVTGLETASQRSTDYLSVALLNPVAPADQPKRIITDCYSIMGGEANLPTLTNLARTMQAVGFNAADIYHFEGLSTTDIDQTLRANGFVNRTAASYLPGVDATFSGGYFSFDTKGGVTTANLAIWAEGLVKGVASSNGGTPQQIVATHMADEPGWYFPTWFNNLNDTTNFPGYLEAFQSYLSGQGAAEGFTSTDLGQSSWTDLHPVGQSIGNPASGGPASIQNRRLYYWTNRFFADASADGMKMGDQALTAAVGRSIPATVNWNNWIDRWYIPSPDVKIGNNPIASADSAEGAMDWMRAGRISANTAWTEDWFDDTQANKWSVYAAVMRSSTMSGTQNFGGHVIGPTLGRMAAGGKYKVFPLMGNGSKYYCGYAFGPSFIFPGNSWSEGSAALLNGVGTGSAYSEYADANRLIGRAERILFPGVAERSRIAVLLPSSSTLWDRQSTQPYYATELYGIHYAVSHGYNVTVDFVDDTDVANGALVANDYYVLYAIAPNVSAKAQSAIESWITTSGAHNRELVLMPGAGTADEYDTGTTAFDTLAGLVAGSRPAIRDIPLIEPGVVLSVPSNDRYTATISIANAAYYFDGQTMNVRGPVQALSPLSGANGPGLTDLIYTTGDLNGKPGSVTKEYVRGGISNSVTAFGFFPGWQYYASADTSYTNQLPQGWSVMAREVAIMPVIRQAPPRTVVVYNGTGPVGETLTETNSYLTASPVEALRLNVGGASPTGIAVVLLNWGGAPIGQLKFNVPSGIANPSTFALASGAALSDASSTGGANAASMTLWDVDVVLIAK